MYISCNYDTFLWLQKESAGLTEMAYGGLVYFLGVVFFKSDGIIPFAHAIWHCFVFVGASLHFWAVCNYLLGKNNIPVTAMA